MSTFTTALTRIERNWLRIQRLAERINKARFEGQIPSAQDTVEMQELVDSLMPETVAMTLDCVNN